jgi:hypothetical protein
LPQVPYQKFPTAEPTSPGESISVQTPGAAFGENIGAALSHLGTTGEQVGNELFTRAIALQDLANENAARNKVVDFTNQAALLQADFDTKTGIDAKNALPDHLKAIADLRNNLRGTLSSPMAQKYFDNEAASFQNRATFSSAAHAGQQFKAYTIDTYDATRDMALRNVEDNPNDPNYYHQQSTTAVEAAKQAAMLRAGTHDESDPIVKNVVDKTQQAILARQIKGIAHDNPIGAQKLLDANRDKLGDEFDPLQSLIETKGTAVASSNIIDGVLNKHKQPDGSYDATTQQMQDEAKKLAQDQFPQMSLLPQHTVAEIKSRLIQENFARDQDKRANEQALSQLLLKNPTVMDTQELLAVPGGDVIVNKMNPKERLELPNFIRTVRTQENSQEWPYNKVRANGLASNNVTSFLEQNFNTWNLEPTERLRLQQQQTTLAQKPTVDPRVSSAMSVLQTAFPSQLEAMNVRRADRNDPDSDWTHFNGALQESLQTWQEDHGKPAGYDDIIGPIFKDLMSKQAVSRSFMHPFTTEDFSFKQFQKPLPTEVPESFRTKATNDAVKAGGVNPSDDQIYRAYLRMEYIKLFGKSDGGTGSGPGANTPSPPISR